MATGGCGTTPADLTNEVTEYLVGRVSSFKDRIDATLIERGLFERPLEHYKVVIGENTPIDVFPAVRIIYDRTETEWFATRTRSDARYYYIDVLSKNVRREIRDELLWTIASTVQNLLVQFNFLQFSIPDTHPTVTAYDSWAGNLSMGYSNDGALNIARINWWCKVFNPYVLGR